MKLPMIWDAMKLCDITVMVCADVFMLGYQQAQCGYVSVGN